MTVRSAYRFEELPVAVHRLEDAPPTIKQIRVVARKRREVRKRDAQRQQLRLELEAISK